MKKLVLSLAILGFITFGAMGVQNLIASSTQVEMVNFDKDPKKDGDKKVAESKEVKAEAKTTEADAKACPSTCSDKSASAKSCCGAEKAGCSTSTPDKK